MYSAKIFSREAKSVPESLWHAALVARANHVVVDIECPPAYIRDVVLPACVNLHAQQGGGSLIWRIQLRRRTARGRAISSVLNVLSCHIGVEYGAAIEEVLYCYKVPSVDGRSHALA